MAVPFRELPHELTSIILSKLPVKSLLRFKCVCKSWYSLVKSPHFIDLHLRNRPSTCSKYEYLIVCRFIDQRHERHVLSLYSYETLDDLCSQIDTPFSDPNDVVTVTGPCNGLLCIIRNYREIVICNPATREFRPLFVPPLLNPEDETTQIYSVAIGFDPDTGLYEVVKIVLCYHESDSSLNDSDAKCQYKIEVYEFSTNSWIETDIVVPDKSYCPDHGILLNGAFHFHLLNTSEGDSSIFSIHVSDRVTGFIPLPGFCSGQDRRIMDLSIFNESLALIVYDRDERYEIWVMTEYGVKESWTVLFKLGPLFGIQFPIGIWKDEQLLLQTTDRQLASCDLRHQTVDRFPIYASLSVRRIAPLFGVLPYFESLVSVYDINGKKESA